MKIRVKNISSVGIEQRSKAWAVLLRGESVGDVFVEANADATQFKAQSGNAWIAIFVNTDTSARRLKKAFLHAAELARTTRSNTDVFDDP